MESSEVSIVEQSITEIDQTLIELRQEITQLEMRIETLNKVKFNLSKLLPHDKRLERLFK